MLDTQFFLKLKSSLSVEVSSDRHSDFSRLSYGTLRCSSCIQSVDKRCHLSLQALSTLPVFPDCNSTTAVVGCVGSIGAQDCRACSVAKHLKSLGMVR